MIDSDCLNPGHDYDKCRGNEEGGRNIGDLYSHVNGASTQEMSYGLF